MSVFIGIVVLVGSFTLSLVFASLIITLLEILFKHFSKTPTNETNKRHNTIYKPYPIQYIRRLFYLYYHKRGIKQSEEMIKK